MVLLVLLAISQPAMIYAGQEFGTINGTISGPGPLNRAKLTIEYDNGRVFHLSEAADGTFSQEIAVKGKVRITCQAQGTENYQLDTTYTDFSDTLRLNIRLQPGPYMLLKPQPDRQYPFLRDDATGLTEAAALQGSVIDKITDQPIYMANVGIVGKRRGALVDSSGHYEMRNVPPGLYSIRAASFGYKKIVLDSIRLVADSVTTVNFKLDTTTIVLEPIWDGMPRRRLNVPEQGNPAEIDVHIDTLTQKWIEPADSVRGKE